jgi:hypothetical protein
MHDFSTLSKEYIFAMVQGMYHFEAHDVRSPELLNDRELIDFYNAFIGHD